MITIDPPLMEMTLAQRLELLEQLEATLPRTLGSEWSPPFWVAQELADREKLLRDGIDSLIPLETFATQVREECKA
jgi:hypothetical protein